MSESFEIHLLRHAHSSHAVAGERDHLRGLDERGGREVAALRERLTRTPVGVDRIVCSTARRARLTLAPLLPLLGGVEPRHDDDLYALGASAYEAVIHRADEARRLLIVGHDPAIGTLLRNWCPDDGDRLAGGVGTAVWATVRIDRNHDGTLEGGRLVELLPPV